MAFLETNLRSIDPSQGNNKLRAAAQGFGCYTGPNITQAELKNTPGRGDRPGTSQLCG